MDPTAYLYTDNRNQNWGVSTVTCTEVQISKSLALLGMSSWDELEPGKLFNCLQNSIKQIRCTQCTALQYY